MNDYKVKDGLLIKDTKKKQLSKSVFPLIQKFVNYYTSKSYLSFAVWFYTTKYGIDPRKNAETLKKAISESLNSLDECGWNHKKLAEKLKVTE